MEPIQVVATTLLTMLTVHACRALLRYLARRAEDRVAEIERAGQAQRIARNRVAAVEDFRSRQANGRKGGA